MGATFPPGVLTSQLRVPPAARSRGAIMGDSITADAFSAGSGSTYWNSWGWATWMRRYCGQRIDLPGSRVFATGGLTIAQIRDTWLAPCIAAKPDWVIVMAGKNSLGSGLVADRIAELKQIYDALLNANIYVIALPVRSCNSPSALTGSALLFQAAINNWIKEYCRANSGCTFIDVNPSYIDFSTGNVQSGYLRDGIHDNVASAMMMGQLIANVINGLIPARDDRFIHLGDVYNATSNPNGNMLVNGLMAGTGGTNQNGATGTPPTSWNGTRSAGGGTMTLAVSKTAYSGYVGLDKTTLTVGGTLDSTQATVNQYTTLADNKWAVGDTVVAEIEADFTITTGTFYGVYLLLVAYTAGFATLATAYDGNYTSANGPIPAGTYPTQVLRTDPFIIPPNCANLNIFAGVAPATSGSANAVFNFARASLRKVQTGV